MVLWHLTSANDDPVGFNGNTWGFTDQTWCLRENDGDLVGCAGDFMGFNAMLTFEIGDLLGFDAN